MGRRRGGSGRKQHHRANKRPHFQQGVRGQPHQQPRGPQGDEHAKSGHQDEPEEAHLNLDVISNPHTLTLDQLRQVLSARGIALTGTESREDLLEQYLRFVAPRPQRAPRQSRRRHARRMAAKRRPPDTMSQTLEDEGRELKRTKDSDEPNGTTNVAPLPKGAELTVDEHGEQVVKKANGFQFKVITWP